MTGSRDLMTKARLHIADVAVGEALLSGTGERCTAPEGALFAVVMSEGARTTAVAIVGRPVPPAHDDGFTLEVTRTRTNGSATAEVSLYRAVWQLVRLRGYSRLITHTDMAPIRRCLGALGLTPVAAVPPRSGAHVPARLRVGRGVDGACRVRWERQRTVPAPLGPRDVSAAAAIPLAGRTPSQCERTAA